MVSGGSSKQCVSPGVANSGQDEELSTRTATRLVDMLLDAQQTRGPTIQAMRQWMLLGAFPGVIDAAKVRLDASERALLAEDD